MEDLSSLEGPPMRDERFAPVSMPAPVPVPVPMSPLSSSGSDPARVMPIFAPSSVSPLSTPARSFAGSISSLRFPIEDTIFPPGSIDQRPVSPLRSSRSHSALNSAINVPPRSASADNVTSAPFWLMVNGRLVWVEDMQLWVLWDEVEAAKAYEKGTYDVYRDPNRIEAQHRNLERRTGKSLPPLPHEIHHLLPMDSQLSTSSNSAWQKPRVQRRHSQSNQSSARLQLQWASLAGQLAPSKIMQSQKKLPRKTQVTDSVSHIPRSLQAGHPTQQLHPTPGEQSESKLYYYS